MAYRLGRTGARGKAGSELGIRSQPVDIASRVDADKTTPTERATGFAITAAPVLVVIAMAIGGLVTLAFTGAEILGWFLTGVGCLGIVALCYIQWQQERNSPGGVERGWMGVERHRSDNDTEVRLAAVDAEKEVRLAAIREYGRIARGDHDTLPASAEGAKRLPGR
ncbi:MAG: hypothetical protein R2932_00925 [Caldilineaceae bacterium]